MRRRPATSVANTTASAANSRVRTASHPHVGGDRHAVDRQSGVKPHAVALQVLLQRIPQCDIEVRIDDVEDQSLAGAEEVDVEHRRELARRQTLRPGEEAAGEHLERQMPRGVGKVDVLQERFGIPVVEIVSTSAGTDTVASGAAALASSRTRSRSRKVGLRIANASAFSGGVRGSPRNVSLRPAPSING